MCSLTFPGLCISLHIFSICGALSNHNSPPALLVCSFLFILQFQALMSLHLGHLSPQDQVRCLAVSLTGVYFLFTTVYHPLHCKSLGGKGCVLFPSSGNLSQCICCLLLQWDCKTKHFNSQWLKGTVVQILLVLLQACGDLACLGLAPKYGLNPPLIHLALQSFLDLCAGSILLYPQLLQKGNRMCKYIWVLSASILWDSHDLIDGRKGHSAFSRRNFKGM